MENNIRTRIKTLIKEAQELRRGNEGGQVMCRQQLARCKAWMHGALNIVRIVCNNPTDINRQRCEHLIVFSTDSKTHETVGEFSDLLSHLLDEIRLGLISSIANRTRAETFDDFLNHAAEYYKEGRKSESGVIAGVVFEDTIRRICEKFKISEKGLKLDDLISTLAKEGI